MSETRHIIEYLDNVEVNRIPYEVSNEQLQDEADRATAETYLATSPNVITQPEMWWLLRYFARQLELKVGSSGVG